MLRGKAMRKLLSAAVLVSVLAGASYAHEDSGKMKMDGHMGMMDMKSVDANSDGQISKQEFASHHDKMFQMMDKNKDSMLSAEEHHMMMGKMMQMMGMMMQMEGGGMMKGGGMMGGGMMKGEGTMKRGGKMDAGGKMEGGISHEQMGK
jgi:hypothetical protein